MAEGRSKQRSILSFLSPKISSQESTEDDEIIIQPKNQLQGSTIFSKIATPVSSEDPEGSPISPSDVHTQFSSESTVSHESHQESVPNSTENLYPVDINSSSSNSSMASAKLLDTEGIPDSTNNAYPVDACSSNSSITMQSSQLETKVEDVQLHRVASDPTPIKECVAPQGAMGSVAAHTIPTPLNKKCGLTKDTPVDLSKFNIGPQESPICTISKVDLYQRDFNILNTGNWLNCKLMEAYMGLLIQHSKQNVKLFTSHLLTKYNEKGFDCVKQLMVKDDIFEYDIIVALDNTSKAHWTLLYMNFHMQVLMHLDPYSGRLSKSIVNYFKNFISACHGALHQKQFNWTGWYYYGTNDKGLPLQKGTDDCGIMTLSYAKFLLCDKELFKAHNGTYRQLIASELLSKKLVIVKQDEESSDPDINREGLSDSDTEQLPSYISTVERYARGLSSKSISRRNVEVKILKGSERGAFAARHFRQGDFVCEYAATVICKEESENDQDRYNEAGLGCYCLDAKYQGKWYTFDATLTLNDPGRFINHASKNSNLALMHPMMIGRGAKQRLRIGFMAKVEIFPGDQLFYDYGYRDQPWMISDAKKCTFNGRENRELSEQSIKVQIETETRDFNTTAQQQQQQHNQMKKKPAAHRSRRDCPIEGCTSRNLKSISDHLKVVHKVFDRQKRLSLCQRAKDIYLRKQEKWEREDNKKAKKEKAAEKHSNKKRKAVIFSSSESESDDVEHTEAQASPLKRRKTREASPSKIHEEDLPWPDSTSESSELEELPETPISDKYRFLKREPVNFDIDGFIKYLQTLDGGNKEYNPAKAIGSHVQSFFRYTTPTKPPHAALLNFQALQQYFSHLKEERQFSATTVADKIRALRQAIQYVQYQQSDEGCSRTYAKCQEVQDRLSRWGKGLTKDIKKQRNANAQKSNYEVKVAESPEDFMSSAVVITKVLELIEVAKMRPLIWREIRVVLAYLAAQIIYLNGQRPGVVQRMTITEWEQREEEDDHWVIKVMDHKTTGAFGPAPLAVSNEVVQMMEQYFINIRQNITPQNSIYSKRFFLTNTGNEYTKISERMKDVADSFGLTVPTIGLQRKVVATEFFKSKDDITIRNVQKHMCHSSTTCEQFYQQRDNDMAITSKKAIEEAIKARHFTPAESKCILTEYPISEDSTPSLAICEKICQKYKLQKTKKQIQDHWRSCKKIQK